MMRLSWIVCVGIVCVAIAGCDSNSSNTYTLPPDDSDAPSSADGMDAEPERKITTKNLTLIMYDKTVSDTQEKRPTFIMKSASGEAMSASNGGLTKSSLTDINAQIFPEDGDELNLSADQGVFDQESQIATLDGQVILHSTALDLTMDALEWDNTTRTVKADTPVVLKSEQATLDASSMTMNSESGYINLFDVSGSIHLGATE